MAKKRPNHPHQRDEPAKSPSAPATAPDDEVRGRSGHGGQDRGDLHGAGHLADAGEAPLMKK